MPAFANKPAYSPFFGAPAGATPAAASKPAGAYSSFLAGAPAAASAAAASPAAKAGKYSSFLPPASVFSGMY